MFLFVSSSGNGDRLDFPCEFLEGPLLRAEVAVLSIEGAKRDLAGPRDNKAKAYEFRR